MENTGGRERESERGVVLGHTHTLIHTCRDRNTHCRRADCGSKLAQLSTPPQCSHMAFSLAEGEMGAQQHLICMVCQINKVKIPLGLENSTVLCSAKGVASEIEKMARIWADCLVGKHPILSCLVSVFSLHDLFFLKQEKGCQYTDLQYARVLKYGVNDDILLANRY